jgi:hypothetical protein
LTDAVGKSGTQQSACATEHALEDIELAGFSQRVSEDFASIDLGALVPPGAEAAASRAVHQTLVFLADGAVADA